MEYVKAKAHCAEYHIYQHVIISALSLFPFVCNYPTLQLLILNQRGCLRYPNILQIAVSHTSMDWLVEEACYPRWRRDSSLGLDPEVVEVPCYQEVHEVAEVT